MEELASVLAAGDTEGGNLVFGFGRREGDGVRNKGGTIDETTLAIYEVTASAATGVGAILPGRTGEHYNWEVDRCIDASEEQSDGCSREVSVVSETTSARVAS